jgi:hypothetical protein
MVHDSMRNLEFDKRLARRRGWVDPGRLREAIESLPDATDKIARQEEQAETPAPPAGAGGTSGT